MIYNSTDTIHGYLGSETHSACVFYIGRADVSSCSLMPLRLTGPLQPIKIHIITNVCKTAQHPMLCLSLSHYGHIVEINNCQHRLIKNDFPREQTVTRAHIFCFIDGFIYWWSNYEVNLTGQNPCG